jgi:membrane protease YdiL (CAAX protease family)
VSNADGSSIDPSHRPGLPGIKASLGLFFLIVVVLITLDACVELLAGRIAWVESARFDLAILLPPVAIALILAWYLPNAGLALRDVAGLRSFPLPLVAPLLVSMAGTFAFVTGLLGILELTLGSPEELDARLEELFEGSTPWVRWIGASVVAPFGEEIFFRGLLLRGMLTRHGRTTAIVLSSVLFGLLHAHPYRFVLAMVLGLHLGWWFERTRNLLPCVVAHAFVNFTVGVLLPDVVGDELWDEWSQTESTLRDSIGTLVVGAVIASAAFVWARRALRCYDPVPTEER